MGRASVSVGAGAAAVLVAACCPSPTLTPGPGGVFARYLPADPATPGVPATFQSGEIAPPGTTWPPTAVVADCTADRDELGDFEKALGVQSSDACPVLQTRPVVAVAITPGSGNVQSPHPLDHNLYCFGQGRAIVVV